MNELLRLEKSPPPGQKTRTKETYQHRPVKHRIEALTLVAIATHQQGESHEHKPTRRITPPRGRDVALNEGSESPAWKGVPSWFVIPGLDKNIPPEAQRFMAERAGAREILEIEDASRAVPASRPDEVADLILVVTAHVEQLAQNQPAH